MANNVYVGNPGLNPTVNTGTGQEFSYNPIDPLQVQQAIAAQSAARQAEYEAQQAAQQQAAQQQAAQQAQQQQAAQQAEVPAGTFDPNQTINFTQFAADNGWADSSTFRRKELADKLLAAAKTAGAPPAYLDALNTAMHKKYIELWPLGAAPSIESMMPCYFPMWPILESFTQWPMSTEYLTA